MSVSKTFSSDQPVAINIFLIRSPNTRVSVILVLQRNGKHAFQTQQLTAVRGEGLGGKTGGKKVRGFAKDIHAQPRDTGQQCGNGPREQGCGLRRGGQRGKRHLQ